MEDGQHEMRRARSTGVTWAAAPPDSRVPFANPRLLTRIGWRHDQFGAAEVPRHDFRLLSYINELKILIRNEYFPAGGRARVHMSRVGSLNSCRPALAKRSGCDQARDRNLGYVGRRSEAIHSDMASRARPSPGCGWTRRGAVAQAARGRSMLPIPATCAPAATSPMARRRRPPASR